MSNIENIHYEERIVAYFDILGFKEKIKEKSAEEIYNILQWPQGYWANRNNQGSPFYKNVRCDFFSDSIIFSITPNPADLNPPKIFEHILEIIIGWVNMGVICRGGITQGNIFHKCGKLFGNAMNDAVELEKKAIYPRVLVKDGVFNSAQDGKRLDYTKKNENNYSHSFLKQDGDGQFFIDYFSPLMFENVSEVNKMQEGLKQLDYLKNLSKIIKAGLANQAPRIFDKYLWCLAKYRHFLNDLLNMANDNNSFKRICNIQFTTDDILNFSLQFYKDIFTILSNYIETIKWEDGKESCICLRMYQQIAEIEKWLKANEARENFQNDRN